MSDKQTFDQKQVTADPRGRIAELDAWMASSPWHPRLVPFFVWIVMMFLVSLAMKLSLLAYPVGYAVQCVFVLTLLWRYRKLTPEITLTFHWLAIPSALFLTAAWVGLGWAMAGEFSVRWEALLAGEPLGGFAQVHNAGVEQNWATTTEPHDFEHMQENSPALFWLSLTLRFFGIVVVVAIFEELFTRSLCLRAFHRMRPTAVGLLQILEDMPLIGELISGSELNKYTKREGLTLTRQLVTTPLGQLSVFGVCMSTFIFTINHIPRDWPGCIVCGVTWCLLLWYTNRPAFSKGDISHDESLPTTLQKPRGLGLGPIIWSHGLTNAFLLVYVVWSGDWQFM